MNSKIFSIAALAIFALATIACVVSASGYGGYSAPSYGQQSYAPAHQEYGQNYDRKVGFKTVIYHPYKAVSSRFDHRFYPAYGYNPYPAPSIRTGLEYTIGDIPNQYSGNSY